MIFNLIFLCWKKVDVEDVFSFWSRYDFSDYYEYKDLDNIKQWGDGQNNYSTIDRFGDNIKAESEKQRLQITKIKSPVDFSENYVVDFENCNYNKLSFFVILFFYEETGLLKNAILTCF